MNQTTRQARTRRAVTRSVNWKIPGQTDIYEYGTHYDSVTISSKPQFERRKKPVDLFGNRTPRIVSGAGMITLTRGAIVDENSSAVVTYFGDPGDVVYLAEDTSYGAYPNIGAILGSLQNRLLGDIKDSNVNLAMAMAEFRSTADTVSALMMDAYKAFRSLRRGTAVKDLVRRLKSPRTRADRELANRWLQYQYGVAPLLSDIHGSLTALHKRLEDGLWIYPRPISERLDVDGSFPGASGEYHDTLRVKLKARYMIDNTFLQTLSSVGITNPALVAWELVPWSFVFDWIIPVGDYLNTLDALVGIRQVQCEASFRWQRSGTVIVPMQVGSRASESVAAVWASETRRLERPTTLAPSFPRYNPHITVKRVASAAALIRSIFR